MFPRVASLIFQRFQKHALITCPFKLLRWFCYGIGIPDSWAILVWRSDLKFAHSGKGALHRGSGVDRFSPWCCPKRGGRMRSSTLKLMQEPGRRCLAWGFKYFACCHHSMSQLLDAKERNKLAELSTHLYQAIYPLSIDLSVYPSIHPAIYPSIHLSVHVRTFRIQNIKSTHTYNFFTPVLCNVQEASTSKKCLGFAPCVKIIGCTSNIRFQSTTYGFHRCWSTWLLFIMFHDHAFSLSNILDRFLLLLS